MPVNTTTYRDLTEHLLDFMGANPGGDAARDARRAAGNGLLLLARSAVWSYYLTRGRIVTSAPYTTGTVTYDSTTRLLTLDGGTWPSWAGTGRIVLGQLSYQASARIADATLKLSSASCPSADSPAGTSYTLYRDAYPLPIDCTAVDRVQVQNNWLLMEYVHPSAWLSGQRLYRGPALPRWYTVTADPSYVGVMSLFTYPAPDNEYELQFIYNRQPRALKTEAYSTGRVSVGAGQYTLTGVGTSFSQERHCGTIIRLSDSTTLPTSDVGANPAAVERVVLSVESTTSLTLDQPVASAMSGVGYVISDPADVEPLAMKEALLRACEYQLAISRNRRDRAELEGEWTQALIRAREADSRNSSAQAEGRRHPWPLELKYMPSGPDVS